MKFLKQGSAERLLILLALSLFFLAVGCTARGGWPRFLRWGEASDGAIKRDLARMEAAKHGGIPNFAIVEPGLYRGGEPSDEGWKYLQSLGVHTTLRLDYKKENRSGVAVPRDILEIQGELPPSDLGDILTQPSQQDLVLRSTWIAGAMKLKKIDPLMAKFSKMTDPQIGVYLSASMTVTNGSVFVHCLHGQDRTGLVIAYYRVLFGGWTKAAAEKEMLDHGFHKALHGLWECWETFKQTPSK